MGKRVIRVSVAFVAVVALGVSSLSAQAGKWAAPPAKWVSDLQGRDRKGTYNTINAVSDGGRYVVFQSFVYDRPTRLFLMNVGTGNFRQLDRSFDGKRRSYKGGSWRAYSASPNISPDGRYVAFESNFDNLVRDDVHEGGDVFLYDRLQRRLRLVSRGPEGGQANGRSSQPEVTPDGRFVVFTSRATNLADADPTRDSDVYLRDLETKEVTLVSVGDEGKGDGASFDPGISHAGDRISFLSHATNLVEGDTNDAVDAFVRDLTTGETTRVSVDSEGGQLEPFVYSESASVYRDGAEELDISGNGEVVVFSSHANGLVPDDDNDNVDIFVHGIGAAETARVSVRSDGGDAYRPEDKECGNNGQCFGFIQSWGPSISADGRRVYFLSAAPLLTDEDDDSRYNRSEENAFVHDRQTDETTIVSRTPNGAAAESSNWYPGSISADGLWVTYANDSRRIDGPAGDEDPNSDVFLQQLPVVPPAP